MNKTLLCLSMLAAVLVATGASAQAPVTDDELATGLARCHADRLRLVVPKTDADRQEWANCMAINAEIAKRYNAKRPQDAPNSDIVNRLKKQ